MGLHAEEGAALAGGPLPAHDFIGGDAVRCELLLRLGAARNRGGTLPGGKEGYLGRGLAAMAGPATSASSAPATSER